MALDAVVRHTSIIEDGWLRYYFKPMSVEAALTIGSPIATLALHQEKKHQLEEVGRFGNFLSTLPVAMELAK